jgi:hypothetical protein
MEVVVVLVVLAVLAIVILVVLQKSTGNGDLPVTARPLMSARERKALEAIKACMPHCRVHAQVAMGALVNVRPGVDRKRRAAVRNIFSQKIVDFVLEERSSGRVLAIVEVDDRTHRADKDAERDRITRAAGYRNHPHPGRIQARRFGRP